MNELFRLLDLKNCWRKLSLALVLLILLSLRKNVNDLHLINYISTRHRCDLCMFQVKSKTTLLALKVLAESFDV